MSKHKDWRKEFQKHTGLEEGRNLMATKEDRQKVSREIHVSQYPISPERFVTFECDNYMAETYGQYGSFHIRVWEDRQLQEMVFIEPVHLFEIMAVQRHSYSHTSMYDKDKHIRAYWYEDQWEVGTSWVHIQQGSYVDEDDPEGKLPDSSSTWEVHLKGEELRYLVDKLAPLKGYSGDCPNHLRRPQDRTPDGDHK